MQLSVRDAARILGAPERTIYRWIREGDIPACRVGERYRFNRAELLEWALSRKLPVSADLIADRDGVCPLPSFAEALDRGGVFRHAGAAGKEEALRAVVGAMPLPPGLDREFLHGVLLAREALGSTAVGDGIAVPHVRNPILLRVAEPVVTLCFLDPAVDFGALDGQRVHTLFTVVSSTVRVHLHLLARLAFALRDAGFKQAVQGRSAAQEIVREARRLEASPANPSYSTQRHQDTKKHKAM